VLIPSLGSGPERRLLEVAAPNNQSKWRLKLLFWSADGKWLIVPDAPWPDGPMGLFLVSVETGEKRRLTQTARYDDLEPAFSPDMRHVAFARYSGAGTSCIYVLELSNHLDPTGEPKQLTFSPGENRSPVWAAQGQMLLFSQEAGAGKPSLWYITISKNARARALPVAADNAIGIAASRGGDRLVYTRSVVNSNIWAFETSGGPLWTDHNRSPRPWITSTFHEVTPAFSPDGRQIAVQSNRSGWSEIWVHDRDGSHARQLTDLRGVTAGFPHWSPDGKKIVFHLRHGGNTGEAILYMVEVATGRSTRILAADVNEQVTPSWSRDGKWIYFASRQSGTYEVWNVPAAGGIATRITRNGGSYPSESADGKQLFYTKVDNSLWRMPVNGGIEQRLVSDIAADGSAFAVGKSGVYFVREAIAGAARQIGFYTLANGNLKVLANVSRPMEMGLAVSPDETLLLYPQVDQLGGNLMLVENFRLGR
jgi:Tol biopolymer transport system component